MGRMLESLKRGEGAGGAFVSRVDKPHTPIASDVRASSDSLECEEGEVPFIEIGAPGKRIEASPAVLAAVKTKSSVPHRESKSLPALMPTLTEPKPLQVAYEPWPRSVLSARPVAPEVIAFHQPDHSVSKQYAELLVKILESIPMETAPVVLLCGSAANVGTTTVLLNLAVCGSRGKSRVIVVDANSKNPALAHRLGMEAAAGWKEIMAGTITLEQAVQAIAKPALHVLAGGESDASLKVEAVRWVLAWLRERFDLILIDGPDLAQTADLATLANNADAIYLVTPDGELSASQLSALTQPLTQHGGRVRGLIRTHYETEPAA